MVNRLIIITGIIIITTQFFAFAQGNDQKFGFEIQGQVANAENGTRIYLIHSSNNKPDTSYAAAIKNEKFNIKGEISILGEFHFLKIQGKQETIGLLLDNSRIKLNTSIAKWPEAKIEGSFTQNQYLSFKRKIDKIIDKRKQIYKHIIGLDKDNDSSLIKELLNESNVVLISDQKNLVVEFIKKNPNSLYTPFLIAQHIFTLKEKDIEYSKLGRRAKESYYGIQLFDELEKNKNVRLGNFLPNISSLSPERDTISPKDIAARGRITLIDFWASWCIPCREEAKNLKHVYQKYNAKGFNILSISLDTNEDSWKRAIKNDSMTWFHASQLKGRNEDLAAFLDINAIPAQILLDKQGRILALHLPGSRIKSGGAILVGKSLSNVIDNILNEEGGK